MLAIVVENLKLILLFFMIVTIIALSWLGNERWVTASRSTRQHRTGMRERKAASPRQAVAKKLSKPGPTPNLNRISTQLD
jgi:hypothetical protein